mmetsp:Transcript_6952/g.28538  ORF Transcript_6952/g.28538 Transcript_6952/m.28538 type:complete len:283 (+) Transcript_6952:200-1048(+)
MASLGSFWRQFFSPSMSLLRMMCCVNKVPPVPAPSAPAAPRAPAPVLSGIFVLTGSLRRARSLSPGALRPGMGSRNMGSACGAYAVLPSSTRTKSARDVARGFRPTHVRSPRALRVASYRPTVTPDFPSPQPRNSWFSLSCHSAATQFPGVPILRTSDRDLVSNTASAPSPRSDRARGASTPVKKYSPLGENETRVSSCVVSRPSNVFTGFLKLRTSQTRSVPSAHRLSKVCPSLANARLVTDSPAGCAPLIKVLGRPANDHELSTWHCCDGGNTRPTDALR